MKTLLLITALAFTGCANHRAVTCEAEFISMLRDQQLTSAQQRGI